MNLWLNWHPCKTVCFEVKWDYDIRPSIWDVSTHSFSSRSMCGARRLWKHEWHHYWKQHWRLHGTGMQTGLELHWLLTNPVVSVRAGKQCEGDLNRNTYTGNDHNDTKGIDLKVQSHSRQTKSYKNRQGERNVLQPPPPVDRKWRILHKFTWRRWKTWTIPVICLRDYRREEHNTEPLTKQTEN